MACIRPAAEADAARIVTIHDALLHTTAHQGTELDHPPAAGRVQR